MNERLLELAPAALRSKELGAEDGVSRHYQFMTTTEIIEGLSKMGWDLFDAKQQRSKKRPETTKHMLVFRNQQYGTLGNNGNIPQILLINSHDRTAALKFMVGIFRNISFNSLIVCDETFDRYNIRHMGTTFEAVKGNINHITENLPEVFNAINRFEGIIMSPEDQLNFAINSLAIRFPEYIDTKTNEVRSDIIQKKVNVEDLLVAEREEDKGDNLWLTFNRVQGHIINGGFQRMGITDQSKSVRPLTNIRMNILVNKGLWKLMDDYSQG